MSNNKSVNQVLDEARESIGDSYSSCCADLQGKIKSAPITSIAIAGGVAYFASFLPVGALLRAIIKVSLALIKPGLFVFGVVKLVEYLRSNESNRLVRKRTDSEQDPVLDSPVGPPSA